MNPFFYSKFKLKILIGFMTFIKIKFLLSDKKPSDATGNHVCPVGRCHARPGPPWSEPALPDRHLQSLSRPLRGKSFVWSTLPCWLSARVARVSLSTQLSNALLSSTCRTRRCWKITTGARPLGACLKVASHNKWAPTRLPSSSRLAHSFSPQTSPDSRSS